MPNWLDWIAKRSCGLLSTFPSWTRTRHVHLFVGDVDLKDRNGQFADLRQCFDGGQVATVGRVEAPLVVFTYFQGCGSRLGRTDLQFVDLQPTSGNPIHQ